MITYYTDDYKKTPKVERFFLDNKLVLEKNYIYKRNNHTPHRYYYTNIGCVMTIEIGDIKYKKLMRNYKLTKINKL